MKVEADSAEEALAEASKQWDGGPQSLIEKSFLVERGVYYFRVDVLRETLTEATASESGQREQARRQRASQRQKRKLSLISAASMSAYAAAFTPLLFITPKPFPFFPDAIIYCWYVATLVLWGLAAKQWLSP